MCLFIYIYSFNTLVVFNELKYLVKLKSELDVGETTPKSSIIIDVYFYFKN